MTTILYLVLYIRVCLSKTHQLNGWLRVKAMRLGCFGCQQISSHFLAPQYCRFTFTSHAPVAIELPRLDTPHVTSLIIEGSWGCTPFVVYLTYRPKLVDEQYYITGLPLASSCLNRQYQSQTSSACENRHTPTKQVNRSPANAQSKQKTKA